MIAIPPSLASSARARPDHPAIVADEGALTYAALRDRAAARAGALAEAGARPGDTIALIGPPSLEQVINLHAVAWLGGVAAPLSHRIAPAQLDERLRALRPALILDARRPIPDGAPLPERDWPLDETRLLLSSSGSTGAPKTIPLTTAQIVFSATGSMIRLGHDPSDRWLCCLPLNHVGGLSILLRCAMYGTTVVLHPRFDAARVARALDSGRIALASLVPAMLRAALDARGGGAGDEPDAPLPSGLRAILLGGGPCPPDLLARCRAMNAPAALTWGMTELASQACTRAPGDYGPAHSGPPLAFARVTTAGGCLTVEGPVAPGGRLVTRDMGHLDAQGRVVVTGRRDDMILSGGENIDPKEIEAALAAHPAIRECAVTARPDPRWGQRPVAWLVAEGAERPVEDALRTWCRARLEDFKTPDVFRWLEALPRTDLGKIARGRLVES